MYWFLILLIRVSFIVLIWNLGFCDLISLQHGDLLGLLIVVTCVS